MPPPGSEIQPALAHRGEPVANTALVMNAAPGQNFSVPAPPDRSGPLSARWYILARYTRPPARCGIAEPDGGAACCGLMVFAYPYAMARGDYRLASSHAPPPSTAHGQQTTACEQTTQIETRIVPAGSCRHATSIEATRTIVQSGSGTPRKIYRAQREQRPKWQPAAGRVSPALVPDFTAGDAVVVS